LGGVGDGGEDVVTLETGIVRQDLLDGGAVGEEFEYIGHADTHTPDAGLAAALAGLDRDA